MYGYIRVINGIFLLLRVSICLPNGIETQQKKRCHASIVCLQLRRYLFLFSEIKTQIALQLAAKP